MKKLLIAFLTLFLFVSCLCIPSFALDDECISHQWDGGVCYVCGFQCIHDYDETSFCPICLDFCSHYSMKDGICSTCGYQCYHFFNDRFGGCYYCGYICSHNTFLDGLCSLCGYPQPGVHVCEHFSAYSWFPYVGADGFHLVGCSVCSWSAPMGEFYCFAERIPIEDVDPQYFEPHDYSGGCFCGLTGTPPFDTQFVGLYCSHLLQAESIVLTACTDGHYLSCDTCGYYRSLEDFFVALDYVPPGFDSGHIVGGSDDMCSTFGAFVGDMGIPFEIIEVDAPASDHFGSPVLSSATALVTAAVGWIAAFVLCIVSNPLLLIFVISIFAILGLYLIKRTIHL